MRRTPVFTFLLALVWSLACFFPSAGAQQIPLDIAEEAAMQSAANWAQGSVVQIETFGGMEIVNKQAVAPGPSTGTVLSKEGWIATSNFLFKGQPASITVILPNEERKAAKLVARDFSREIACLKSMAIHHYARSFPAIPLHGESGNGPSHWEKASMSEPLAAA